VTKQTICFPHPISPLTTYAPPKQLSTIMLGKERVLPHFTEI